MAHVSNVLGMPLPIADLARSVRRYAPDAVVVVDGAQAVAHLPVAVRELGCDFYAFSGHKLYGPDGIGVLWMRRELACRLGPFEVGGGMVAEVGSEAVTLRDVPYRFEAGTVNVAGAVGLGAAVEYVSCFDRALLRGRELELLAHALRELNLLDGVECLPSPQGAVGVLSFTVRGVHPHDFVAVAADRGVAVRGDNLCAEPLLRALGHHAVVRLSIGMYNDEADIDALVEVVRAARSIFAGS